jgi:hypothetical protein
MKLKLLISRTNLPINVVNIYTGHDAQLINLRDKITFKTLPMFKQAMIFKLLITWADLLLTLSVLIQAMMFNVLIISGTNLSINFVNIYTDHDALCINLWVKCSFII